MFCLRTHARAADSSHPPNHHCGLWIILIGLVLVAQMRPLAIHSGNNVCQSCILRSQANNRVVPCAMYVLAVLLPQYTAVSKRVTEPLNIAACALYGLPGGGRRVRMPTRGSGANPGETVKNSVTV